MEKRTKLYVLSRLNICYGLAKNNDQTKFKKCIYFCNEQSADGEKISDTNQNPLRVTPIYL